MVTAFIHLFQIQLRNTDLCKRFKRRIVLKGFANNLKRTHKPQKKHSDSIYIAFQQKNIPTV